MAPSAILDKTSLKIQHVCQGGHSGLRLQAPSFAGPFRPLTPVWFLSPERHVSKWHLMGKGCDPWCHLASQKNSPEVSTAMHLLMTVPGNGKEVRER